MKPFDPRNYPPAVAELITDELNELGPGKPRKSRRAALDALDAQALAGGQTVRDTDMAQCCVSALWLLHDFLDESHRISQDVHTTSGSYWHGIMHRREPDYENAKYWFRRVGDHPVFVLLAQAASDLAAQAADKSVPSTTREGWDPFRFVDLCEKAQAGGALAVWCRQVQRAEWQLLFDHCYRAAVGS